MRGFAERGLGGLERPWSGSAVPVTVWRPRPSLRPLPTPPRLPPTERFLRHHCQESGMAPARRDAAAGLCGPAASTRLPAVVCSQRLQGAGTRAVYISFWIRPGQRFLEVVISESKQPGGPCASEPWSVSQFQSWSLPLTNVGGVPVGRPALCRAHMQRPPGLGVTDALIGKQSRLWFSMLKCSRRSSKRACKTGVTFFF